MSCAAALAGSKVFALDRSRFKTGGILASGDEAGDIGVEHDWIPSVGYHEIQTMGGL